MAGRFSNGLSLVGQSWRVLKVDKELVLFPVFSTIASLLVMASFVVPLAFNGQFERWFGQAGQQAGQQSGRGMPADPLFFVWLFSFYFVSYAVITFFNAALISAAIERFGGGKPTIGSGLAAAASRMPQILAWALVSATVGMILKVIEDRGKGVGKFVAGLLGAAWSIATYFVVPVLVVEKVGPIEAVKRSGSIIKKTWGEGLTGNLGISVVFFLLFLLAALPAIAGGRAERGRECGARAAAGRDWDLRAAVDRAGADLQHAQDDPDRGAVRVRGDGKGAGAVRSGAAAGGVQGQGGLTTARGCVSAGNRRRRSRSGNRRRPAH